MRIFARNHKGRFSMKYNNPALVLSALAMLGTIGTSGAANAADFAQTTAAQQFSVTHGFAQSALSMQRRVAPGTAAGVTSGLIGGLCAGPCALQSLSRRANELRATGSGWSLNVSADGSAARFEDLAVQRQGPALAKDPSQALTAARLEGSDRAVIASKLRSVIVLGPQEELVPVRTDYLIAGMQNVKTNAVVRSVIANRIVFGRRLHGVAVVGGGSTVTLTFANNGALESWRYDWPRYQAAASQTIVNVTQIVQRIKSVIGARKVAGRVPSNARQISGKIQANAPIGKPGAALQKLECGHFDPGVAARSASALVQPGCLYHVVARDSDGFRQGFAGAVPAGVAFTRDAGWIETSILPSRP
jgi:hypothetical protein